MESHMKKSHVSSLHSILVKSIHALNRDIIVIIKRLYIPFWLNLYASTAAGGSVMIMLYIPFWLNLYLPEMVHPEIWFTLHSILVKSIHAPFRNSRQIVDFTFHSG